MPNESTVLVFTYSTCGKQRQWRLPTPSSKSKRLSRVPTVRWDSSASIVTTLRACSLTNGGSIARRGKRFNYSPAVHIDSGDNTMDTWGWRGQGVKLTIQLHLVKRLRMSGPTPPLPTRLPRVHTDNFLRHSHKDLQQHSRGRSSGNESAFDAVFVGKRTYVSL
jgi:hypothetical protein